MRLPGTDPAKAAKWLAGLHPGPWTVSALHPDGTPPRTLTTDKVSEVAKFIDRYADTHGLYYNANRIAPGVRLNKKLGKTEVGTGFYSQGDYDTDVETGKRLVLVEGAKDEVAKQLIEGTRPGVPGPATHVIDSGNGIQSLWKLSDPVDLVNVVEGQVTLDEFEGYGRYIADHSNGDHCWAANHLFRLPWTTNYPNKKKRDEDLKPVLTRLLHSAPDVAYDTFTLPWDGLNLSTATAVNLDTIESFDDVDDLLAKYPDIGPGLIERIVGDPEAEKGEDGYVDSDAEWGILKDLYRAGLPLEAVMGALAQPDWALGKRARLQAEAGSRTLQEYLDYTAKRLKKAMDEEQAATVEEFDRVDPEWDALEEDVPDDAVTDPKDSTVTPLHFYSPTDLLALPEPDWVVESLLIEKAVAMLYGGPGAGKTYLSLDLALCVAMGVPFFGLDTARGRVLYFATENNARYIGERIFAWCQKMGFKMSDLDDHFVLVTQSIVMNSVPSVANVRDCTAARGWRTFALIVIDTLNKNMEGNENDGEVMTRFFKGVDVLRRLRCAAVLIIHHTAKNGEDYRGSSVLLGTVDMMMSLTKPAPKRKPRGTKKEGEEDASAASNKDVRVAKVVKSREADDEVVLMLNFQKVELPWKDKKGKQRTTRVFTRLGEGHQATEAYEEIDSESELAHIPAITDKALLIRIYLEHPRVIKDLAYEGVTGWSPSNVKDRVSRMRKDGLIEADELVLTEQGKEFVGDDALGAAMITD